MSLHFSDNVVEAKAKKAAAKKTRKYVVLGAIAAVAVVPTAAYALIVGLTGSGTVEGEGYEAVPLTVTEGAAAPKLFPGSQTDVSFKVNNPNPFPVKLEKVQPTGFSAKDGCAVGLFSTTLPLNGTSFMFPGFSDGDLTVPANGSKTVTIPNAVKLSEGAARGCGFTMPITVTGAQKAATP